MQLHPILLVFVEVIVSSIVIGFTEPCSTIRIGALVTITMSCWQCISTALEFMVRTPWASLVGGYAVTLLFHFIDIALLQQWCFRASGPTEGPVITKRESSVQQKPGSWWERFMFGLSITCSWRCVGTLGQIRNVPPFSDSDLTYIPSRGQFLRNTALTIFLSYVGLDLLGSSADPELNSRFFSVHHIPFLQRLHDVSTEEFVMRVLGTIGAGIGMICVQRGAYSIVAFLSVSLKLNQPRDWPPFYGPVCEAYSMRRYWSRFWHQTNTHKLSAISYFILHDVLKVPQGTFARYLRIATIFIISAIMHLLIDMAAGLSIHSSGAVTFFCTQIVGIIIEDLIAGGYRYIVGRNTTRPLLRVERLLCYAWVAAFLSWSTPVYLYPMMYRTNMGLNDSVVPFSMVKLLGRALA